VSHASSCFRFQLDMESIDALAKAVNEFQGGLVLVSHDMRLIGQVANEIWICDNKTITKYQGDIQSFKMDMRAQMGIDGEAESKTLRGDFSVKQSEGETKKEKPTPAPKAKLEVVPPPKKVAPAPPKVAVVDNDDVTSTSATSSTAGDDSVPAKSRYIPPHLRKKMQQEQQQQ